MNRLRPRISGWMRALAPAAALLACVLLPTAAQAGTTISLFKSFAGNINFVTTGGTRRTSSNFANGGNNTCNVTGTTTNTNMTVSGIPAGSTLVAAYLYYAASGTTTDNTVVFNGTTVTADRSFTDASNGIGDYFSGFKDVTSLMSAGGNGTYTFSGLTISTGNPWCNSSAVLGAYALLVIYSNTSTEPTRVINVYDGFQFFQNDSIAITTPTNGFQIPSTGINGKFAVITWEGDPDISGGEVLQFNSNNLTDTCDSNGNQYNSTINTITCTTNEATNGGIYWGLDFDTYDISSYLTAGETQATTNYASGQDLVFLSAQIISVVNTPVADLSITKVHNGTFTYGNNGSYTLTVTNNGPSTETGIVTVTDTLPAGESFVSASGTGWSCGNVSGTVTCTNPNSGGLTNGSSLSAITLTVNVSGSAGASITNTATVSGVLFDNNSTNSTASDTVSPSSPDLSNSTKSVFTVGGGDALVGSTLQYTVTVTESAGIQASGVSVTDDIPANLSNFTVVSVPSGATNSSTGAGTGANGDGKLNITGITVPANGSVTIVFTAQVASGTANCTAIDNTATVVNPDGPSANGATPSSNTVVVAQSSCASSGNKVLYLYSSIVTGTTHTMSRQPTATNTAVAINGGTTEVNWEQQPVAASNIVLPAQTVTVNIYMTRGGTNSNRSVKVGLAKNSAPGTVLGGQTLTFNPGTTESLHTFSFTIPATTVATGDALLVEVTNTTAGGTNTINVFPLNGTAKSSVTFATSTVINVDSVTAYTTNYSTTTLPPNGVFLPGQTVFICAVVSDPFGSADTDPATGGIAPQITLTDPNGVVQVSGAAMTKEAAANCSGTASTSTEAFEYAFTTTSSVTTGFWNASVTATEGTEGTVTDTANSAFDIDVPSLLITKTASVASDPVEGATRPKAIPGATVTYTITVQNNGRGPVDSGTLIISDPIPTNTGMSLTAKPPFVFTNGATSSGLSVTSGSDANIVYSNNGGTSYVYTPACTRPCVDTAITNFKITLTGSMNGKLGATAPSFTITFNVVIQ